MTSVEKRKYTLLILAFFWTVCLLIFTYGQKLVESYAVSPEKASSLSPLYSCSGTTFQYQKGYRCDGYAPNSLFTATVSTWAFLSVYILWFLKKSAKESESAQAKKKRA